MFLLLRRHIPQPLSPRRIHVGILTAVRARSIRATAIRIRRRSKRIRRMRGVRIPRPVVRVPLLSRWMRRWMCRRMKAARMSRTRSLIPILPPRSKCARILPLRHSRAGETRPTDAPLRRGRLRRKPDRQRDR